MKNSIQYEIVAEESSGAQIKMPVTADGYSLCPVCGSKAENKGFRPYDKYGIESHAICECGIQFGYNCNYKTTGADWNNFRQKWINEELDYGNCRELSFTQKKKQLESIGIYI